MTRALVTQLVEALDAMYSEGLRLGWHAHPHWSTGMANTNAAITAAREYLATEPIGERAKLIARQRWVQEHGANPAMRALAKSTVDMLEADAQPKQVTCQIYGHVVGACVECNTHIEAQQAKRVPMSADDIYQLARRGAVNEGLTAIVREVEAHHHIGSDA